MKVSIVTPLFNERDKIEDYLKMISRQTVKPEIVLVDGGSTDGTVEIIRKYQKKMPNLKLYFEEGEIRSVGNARNVGIKKATGDIIFFIDVDGVVEKDLVKKIKEEFEKHEKDGCVAIRFKIKPLKEGIKSRLQEAFFYRDAARWKLDSHCYVLKKEVIPLFNPKAGYGEDKEWIAEVKERVKGKCCDSDQVLMFFQHGPKDLKDLWRRYLWYGRGYIYYYYRHRDEKIHLMKLLFAFFSVPFLFLALLPAARGFYYSLKVIKEYPKGLIMIPLIEAMAFPIMALGFWQYLLKKNKKHFGH